MEKAIKAIKAIGHVDVPKLNPVHNETPFARRSFYDTRVRKAHTEVKVFENGNLEWQQLPKELDPQFNVKAPFVVYK
jgi:hypothetical protein